MLRLAFLIAVSLLADANSAAAADAPRVGIAAPRSGFAARLGGQLVEGAKLGAGADPVIADTECTAEGGTAAANAFLKAGVSVVTGFLCTEALEAALKALSPAGIAVITPGVRAESLTARRNNTGLLLWRTAPSDRMAAEATADILVRRWRDVPFAIVDDGTIAARDLTETFRLKAEEAGMKPVYVDTFRPALANQSALVRRLRKAGASHVLIGGDRADVAIIARDAAAMGVNLVIAGGEALAAADGDIPLPAGVLMVGLPDVSTGLGEAETAALNAAGILPEGYVIPAWAAAQVAVAAAGGNPPRDLAGWQERLENHSIDTVAGPIRLDDTGGLAANPYRLLRWNGVAFEETD